MSGKDGASVDLGAIKELYRSSRAAKALFDYFTTRENNSVETTVDRLEGRLSRMGRGMPRNEIVEVLRALDEAGCGTFKVGRKGHASRFIWDVSLIGVGKAATGKTTEVPELTEDEQEAASSEDADESDETDVEEDERTDRGLLEHRHVLRHGIEVTVRLPADLTTAEATRLGDWIRTLPFTEGETVADRILLALRVADKPLCDDCLAYLCDLTTRQQANSEARFLHQRGKLQRATGTCSKCGGDKLVNQLP